MLTWFHPSLTRVARPRGACNGAYRCRILISTGFPRHGSQVVFTGSGVIAARSYAVYSLTPKSPGNRPGQRLYVLGCALASAEARRQGPRGRVLARSMVVTLVGTLERWNVGTFQPANLSRSDWWCAALAEVVLLDGEVGGVDDVVVVEIGAGIVARVTEGFGERALEHGEIKRVDHVVVVRVARHLAAALRVVHVGTGLGRA